MSAVDESSTQKSENFFKNENGFNIFCKYWCATMKNPKALVFISHGVSEHCLYYGELAESILKHQLYVFSHDHQGHGQSEGPRVHIKDFRHYIRDVYQHVEMVQKQFPCLPVYILGHSMGGAVSLMSVIDRPSFFAGMVLIGPAVIPSHDDVGPVRIFVGKALAKVFPQAPILKLDTPNISRDNAVVQKYIDDPLCYHGALKAKWGLSMLDALKEIEEKLPNINIPFLVLHGGGDKIVPAKGSEMLHKFATSQDKTLKIYPDAFHQVHSEIEPVKSECHKDITDWFNRMVSA